MDIPEKLVAVDTQDTERRQTKQTKSHTQKTKKMSNTDPTKNQKLDSCLFCHCIV